ncbi:MAG: hypothetical protein Q9217_003974 [Psora testacea]
MSLSPAVQHLLSAMTPQQIANALHSVNGVMTGKTSKIKKPGKSKRKSRAASNVRSKATRPLNSWMAYRSYYSTIFSTLQQKEISGLMKHMWEADPFKAKWAILAKAYSVIRDDQGKGNAPLDSFLAINAPIMDVIEPAHYFKTLGWEVSLDEEGQTVMRLSSRKIDQHFLTTNVSVNDLIGNSYRQGYFTGNLFNVLLSDNEASMTMVTTSRRTEEAHRGDGEHTVVDNSGTSNSLDVRTATTTTSNVTADAVNNEGSSGASNTSGGGVSVENGAMEGASGNANAENYATKRRTVNGEASFNPDTPASARISPGYGAGDSGSATAPNLGDSGTRTVAPVEKLSRSDFELTGEYPFDATFDPDSPTFTFDPFMGNQFDAFEISGGWTDFVNLESCT